MPQLPPLKFFPAAENADPHGLVYVGGELSPQWLIDAYSHGIFPWPVLRRRAGMAWWSPDPRAIFEIGGLHISRRLAETCRDTRFEISFNRDFAGVIDGCGTAQDRGDGTWITPAMRDAYVRLHELGVAHSVEVWHAGQLAGGVYGVALGGMFAGESMFYRIRDASKVALVHLHAHLLKRGYQLFDIQQLTAHSASLGAIEIPRCEFLARLGAALELLVTFDGLRTQSGTTEV